MKTKSFVFSLLFVAFVLCGCQTATVEEKRADGSTSKVSVAALLSNIKNGNYTNGNGTSLHVDEATPDQQSIATLAGGIVELGKAGLLLAGPRTNAAPDTTK